jgi:hypothetical protein
MAEIDMLPPLQQWVLRPAPASSSAQLVMGTAMMERHESCGKHVSAPVAVTGTA